MWAPLRRRRFSEGATVVSVAARKPDTREGTQGMLFIAYGGTNERTHHTPGAGYSSQGAV